MSEADENLELTVSVDWPTTPMPVPIAANQLNVSMVPGPSGLPEYFVCTVGFAAPPPITGKDHADIRDKMGRLSGIEIQPVARFVVGRGVVEEFARVLGDAAKNWDNLAQMMADRGEAAQ